jgi:hypothetical protein
VEGLWKDTEHTGEFCIMNRKLWIVAVIDIVGGMVGGILYTPLILITLLGFLLFYSEYARPGKGAMVCYSVLFLLIGLFCIALENTLRNVVVQPLINRAAIIVSMTLANGFLVTCLSGMSCPEQPPDMMPQRVVLIPEEEFRREHQLTREIVHAEHGEIRKQTGLDAESRRTWTLCDNCGRKLDVDDVERLRFGMSSVCSCGHVNIRGANSVREVTGSEHWY